LRSTDKDMPKGANPVTVVAVKAGACSVRIQVQGRSKFIVPMSVEVSNNRDGGDYIDSHSELSSPSIQTLNACQGNCIPVDFSTAEGVGMFTLREKCRG
jgi:hypothetical protein